MAHPSETAAMVVVLFVAIIAMVLTILAFRAAHRADNPRLRYVGAAFATLAAKGLVVAIALQTQFIGHEHLELVSALFDLVLVLFLVAPFLRR